MSRDQMDDYALRPQHLAVDSQESGFFDREIIAIETPDGEVATDVRRRRPRRGDRGRAPELIDLLRS